MVVELASADLNIKFDWLSRQNFTLSDLLKAYLLIVKYFCYCCSWLPFVKWFAPRTTIDLLSQLVLFPIASHTRFYGKQLISGSSVLPFVILRVVPFVTSGLQLQNLIRLLVPKAHIKLKRKCDTFMTKKKPDLYTCQYPNLSIPTHLGSNFFYFLLSFLTSLCLFKCYALRTPPYTTPPCACCLIISKAILRLFNHTVHL